MRLSCDWPLCVKGVAARLIHISFAEKMHSGVYRPFYLPSIVRQLAPYNSSPAFHLGLHPRLTLVVHADALREYRVLAWWKRLMQDVQQRNSPGPCLLRFLDPCQISNTWLSEAYDEKENVTRANLPFSRALRLDWTTSLRLEVSHWLQICESYSQEEEEEEGKNPHASQQTWRSLSQSTRRRRSRPSRTVTCSSSSYDKHRESLGIR